MGKSAPTKDLKLGVAAAPVVGPDQTKLAFCVANVPVSVPAAVTGLPLTVKILGNAKPTDVTVPVPDTVVHVVVPEPLVDSTCPLVPLVPGSWKVVVPAAAGTWTVTAPVLDPLRITAPPVPPFKPKLGVAVPFQVDAPLFSIKP